MTGVRAGVPMALEWIEPEPYVAPTNGRKGKTAYPFAEMTVGGKVMLVRERSIHAVRDAINRFCKVQKGKDPKFKRRYVARPFRDERGPGVKVWRLL